MVRPFEAADAASVAQLAAEAPQAAQWSEESYAKLRESGYAGWIAVSADDALSGFIITRTISGEAEIMNLAVAPTNRRAGVAAALLKSALESFALGSVRRVYLEVRASNLTAIAFYQKHLFIIVGSRPNYYQYPTESAMLMERIITVSES
jgi:[ribosomal protein S18]-alanine N-acetyltransferase